MIRKNNKGITLVEIMIGMAISTIVIGAIIMFMTSGLNYYKQSDMEIAIQTESQLVINQLSDMALEANWVTAEPNILIFYYMRDAQSGVKKVITRDNSSNQLFLEEIAFDSSGGGAAGELNLLGEYATVMNVTADPEHGGKEVGFSFEFSYRNKKETITNTVVMRNKLLKPASIP